MLEKALQHSFADERVLGRTPEDEEEITLVARLRYAERSGGLTKGLASRAHRIRRLANRLLHEGWELTDEGVVESVLNDCLAVLNGIRWSHQDNGARMDRVGAPGIVVPRPLGPPLELTIERALRPRAPDGLSVQFVRDRGRSNAGSDHVAKRDPRSSRHIEPCTHLGRLPMLPRRAERLFENHSATKP